MSVGAADDRENLSWETFGVACRELAVQIAEDGFVPDIIMAIARGGLFAAGALGYALDVKNLHVTNVEFYKRRVLYRRRPAPSYACDAAPGSAAS
jgi:hypoxanthine phosphoribosyltransferase